LFLFAPSHPHSNGWNMHEAGSICGMHSVSYQSIRPHPKAGRTGWLMTRCREQQHCFSFGLFQFHTLCPQVYSPVFILILDLSVP
jgi:hypothetical protein